MDIPLMEASVIIAPSILAADAARLGEEVKRAEHAGADWIHVDIMDGHFVPNLSFGPHIVEAIRRYTRLPLDVHLMVERPERFIEPFAKAGADFLTIHVELGHRVVKECIHKIRSLGKQVGISINPTTPVQLIKEWLKDVDLVLVMTVNPGYGGQSFITETLPKIKQIASWRNELHLYFRIQVDGGINLQTLALCAINGADTFVSGTTLFASNDMKAMISAFRSKWWESKG